MGTITHHIEKAFGLSRETLAGVYRTMYLSRRLDDKEIQLKRQNRLYFQINGVGHEALNVATALHLKPGYDWFYPYYRDRAFCLQLGLTPLDMLLQAVGSLETPLAFAAVFLISIFGIAIWYVADLVERWTIPWHASQRGSIIGG